MPFPRTVAFDVMAPPQPQAATPPILPQQPSIPASPSSETTSHHEVDQAFADFMTCFTSPPAGLLEEAQASFDQYGTLEGILSPSTTNSPPSHTAPHTTRTRFFPRRPVQPYNAANRRKKLKEKPIYTRRQVDDMLNAVSNCFAGTMEEVLKRVDTTDKTSDKTSDKTPDTIKDNPVQNGSNHELRRMLSDTLPRLFNGLQNLLDDRIKVD
ncbi:hypothetical protein DXG01_004766 [Tephrocybe rancida]|nr:hypothetical protein DXG01_004766 [Tephrocybe rancida]